MLLTSVGLNIYFGIQSNKIHPLSQARVQKVEFSPNCTGTKTVFETGDSEPQSSFTFLPDCAINETDLDNELARVEAVGWIKIWAKRQVFDKILGWILEWAIDLVI
jgi:hypothetical protein